MNQPRHIWIDSLKGFGIICVTLGHTGCFYLLEKHIYSFHMFLFFFISGLLWHEIDSFPKFIQRKTKRLLLPFIVWNVLSTALDLYLGENPENSLLKMLTVDGQLCWNAPIWFLLVLYLTEIIYAFLSWPALKFISPPHFSFFTILLSVFIWYMIGSLSLPLKLNLVPLAMIFYCFGILCRKPLFSKQPLYKSTIYYLIIITSFIISIATGTILNDRISFTGGYFDNYLLCLIAAFSGVAFYSLLFSHNKLLSAFHLTSYLGQHSLLIMVAQYWVFRFLDILFFKLTGAGIWHTQNTIKSILLTILTFVVLCTFAEIYRILAKRSSFIQTLGRYLGL